MAPLAPTSILAPAINIGSLGPWARSIALGPDTHGRMWTLSDASGELSDEGLCIFWALISLVAGSLFYKLGRVFSPLMFKSYSSLTLADKREWDVRYYSMPHSFICVYFAVAVLFSDFYFAPGSPPALFRTCRITYTELGMSFGFFIVDFIICYKYHMGGMPMLIHHVGSLLSIGTAIYSKTGHMHAVWILVTELTTPFINFRWWLEKGGMKSSSLYVLNGVAIFIFWIVARVALFPPFFYVVWIQRDQIKLMSYWSAFLLFTFPALLTVLNLWWFTKITKGVIKLLKGGSKSKTE